LSAEEVEADKIQEEQCSKLQHSEGLRGSQRGLQDNAVVFK